MTWPPTRASVGLGSAALAQWGRSTATRATNEGVSVTRMARRLAQGRRSPWYGGGRSAGSREVPGEREEAADAEVDEGAGSPRESVRPCDRVPPRRRAEEDVRIPGRVRERHHVQQPFPEQHDTAAFGAGQDRMCKPVRRPALRADDRTA